MARTSVTFYTFGIKKIELIQNLNEFFRAITSFSHFQKQCLKLKKGYYPTSNAYNRKQTGNYRL